MTKLKSYRKFLTATVATAVIASTTVVPFHVLDVKAASFTDIKQGAYYYEAVLDLAGRGVINGFEDGAFKPSQDTTRGQAAAMIARALKLEEKDAKDPGFSDVNKDAYYYKAVAALAEAKIVSGVTSDSFKPNLLITRAEMAKMISKAFELKESKTSASKFKDVPANSWYAGFVGALAENGITVGKTATSFDPSNKVDRAQIATFIYRAEKNRTAPVGTPPVGNPPIITPPVVTPPAGGGGPLPSDKTAPTLESATLTIGGQSIAGTEKGGVWVVSLKGLDNTAMFTDINLDSSEEGNASITYSGVNKTSDS